MVKTMESDMNNVNACYDERETV